MQAEAGASLAHAGREEGVEDAVEVFGRNALAIVANRQSDHVFGIAPGSDQDAPMITLVEGVQERVVDHVGERLAKGAGVAV